MTSFINLSGLAIGLTCCLLILIYILHETSYDRYNRNAGRVYRVTRQFNGPGGSVSLHLGTVAPPFGPLLQNDFPDIQAVTRLLEDNLAIRYKDKKFNEDNAFMVALLVAFITVSIQILKAASANPIKNLRTE